MKGRLKLFGTIALRTLLGIPLTLAFLALVYGFIALVAMAIANIYVTAKVVAVLMGLVVSYAFGNMATKRYRRWKLDRKYRTFR